MQSKRPITVLAATLGLALALAGGATAAPAGELPPTPGIEGLPPPPAELELPPVEGLPAAEAGCVVPSVRGKTLVQAVLALRDAGCELGRVTKVPSAQAKKGRVVAQRAAPGTQLPAGARIDLTIGKGKGRSVQGFRFP